jgi:hypothetical protein
MRYWNSENSKGKATNIEEWTRADSTRKLRLPDSSLSAHEFGKITSPKHWLPSPPENIPDTHFR